MKQFKVSEECIGCRACVEVAGNNFDVDNTNLAYLKKQPENEQEESQCVKAMDACPVNAIFEIETKKIGVADVILGNSNIKKTLDQYPELKQLLINLSPKFKRMQNPIFYNTLARFADFNDAAKMTGLSICEILHTVNEYLGVEEKLIKSMPECIKDEIDKTEDKGSPISWDEIPERYIYNDDTMKELIQKIINLEPKQNIVIISVEKPYELLKVSKGLNYLYNVEKGREYRVSIFNPEREEKHIPWQERKDKFEVLDVRTMMTDPFDIIIKKAYTIEDDDGFILIQRFEPYPMINMLSEMGFEHLTDQKAPDEYWIYFHKKVNKERQKKISSVKIDIVIQSATPVAYPVIMRLLQSERIRDYFNIKELKVWEETERHLAWITNGKADISFSALITTAKLKDRDIKIPALFVWDNFTLLTRYKAETLKDILGKYIHTPLFGEAPPAKITRYLIKASGLNPEKFNFVFGNPFGRPEKIYRDFVTGKADTAILREPETSYAIKIMQDRNEEISIIPFNKIWNKINPGFGSYPNAGGVLKGEFLRRHPEEAQIFLEELKSSIEWVNNNKLEAAKLSFDLMRQPVDRIELFLNRVNFEYVAGERLISKVKQYFDILIGNGIVDMKIDDKFLNLFKIDEYKI